MATYKDIQNWVKSYNGFVPKGCWIAHVKELNGLEPRQSPRRINAGVRACPCPENRRRPIEDAMRNLGML